MVLPYSELVRIPRTEPMKKDAVSRDVIFSEVIHVFDRQLYYLQNFVDFTKKTNLLHYQSLACSRLLQRSSTAKLSLGYIKIGKVKAEEHTN